MGMWPVYDITVDVSTWMRKQSLELRDESNATQRANISEQLVNVGQL